MQMMHQTPSLWRRAKMPWIFGNAKAEHLQNMLLQYTLHYVKMM